MFRCEIRSPGVPSRWNMFEPDVGLERLDLAQGVGSMADKPRVSIVIPAYNEAPCLEKLHAGADGRLRHAPFSL